MKAQYLKKDDKVFFSVGNVGTVKHVYVSDTTTIVIFDCLDTVYNNDDELLVGRKGQVL